MSDLLRCCHPILISWHLNTSCHLLGCYFLEWVLVTAWHDQCPDLLVDGVTGGGGRGGCSLMSESETLALILTPLPASGCCTPLAWG